MTYPSTEQARRDVYRAATALLVSDRVNRSTWEEKGRGEAQDQQDRVFSWHKKTVKRLSNFTV